MHLGIYRFTGDPDKLLEGYDKVVAMMPAENIFWHLCAVEPGGIVIFDTCPSEEVFRGFSTSDQFRAALEAAGLPQPEVSDLPVHNALPAL